MKRLVPAMDREALAAEIASLSTLDTDELRERWTGLRGEASSREIGRPFPIRMIAYRLQAVDREQPRPTRPLPAKNVQLMTERDLTGDFCTRAPSHDSLSLALVQKSPFRSGRVNDHL
jgi:hypothetical protein